MLFVVSSVLFLQTDNLMSILELWIDILKGRHMETTISNAGFKHHFAFNLKQYNLILQQMLSITCVTHSVTSPLPLK